VIVSEGCHEADGEGLAESLSQWSLRKPATPQCCGPGRFDGRVRRAIERQQI